MLSILEQIAADTRERVAAQKKRFPAALVRELAGKRSSRFFEAVKAGGVIAEIKRASPSKGLIAPDFDYVRAARAYDASRAAAISVLTEPRWFMGSAEILTAVRAHSGKPVLRKDFILDPYQIYGAAALGADAVLLIVSLVKDRLAELLALCGSLGLDALTETRDEREIEAAADCGARVIGVNSRDLRDFTVDTERAVRFLKKIPASCAAVLESGIRCPSDAERAFAAGADAILAGESVMCAVDPTAFIDALDGARQCRP